MSYPRNGITIQPFNKQPISILGETIIHLDMDADRNGTKPIPGSNKGGLGRININAGLIDRIEIAAKNEDKNCKKEVELLNKMLNIIKKSAQKRNDNIGLMPANGKLVKSAEKLLTTKFGTDWIQVILAKFL